jgi:hypothetical protein
LRQIAAAWAAQNREGEWIAHGRLTGRSSAGSRQFCLASAVLSLSLIKLMLRNSIFFLLVVFLLTLFFLPSATKQKEKKGRKFVKTT